MSTRFLLPRRPSLPVLRSRAGSVRSRRHLARHWALAVLLIAGACDVLMAQSWRTALTLGANAALWIDYSQISYGNQFGVPTTLFGVYLDGAVLPIVNGIEVGINSLAPKRWRPWINVITIAGHIPYLIHWSHRPIGVLYNAQGQRIMRIGWRFWP